LRRYIGGDGTWTDCVLERTFWRPKSEAQFRSSSESDNHLLTAYGAALYWALLVVLGSSVDPTNLSEYLLSIAMTLIVSTAAAPTWRASEARERGEGGGGEG
jgi:hypothetical protein